MKQGEEKNFCKCFSPSLRTPSLFSKTSEKRDFVTDIWLCFRSFTGISVPFFKVF